MTNEERSVNEPGGSTPQAALPPQIRQIGHDTPAYRDMVALRYRVLREPLGLHYTPEQLAGESDDMLLGAYVNGTLTGCLILSRIDARVAQMRQVAVAPERQGSGIGRALATWAETWARAQGYATLLLHARESAMPFYLKLGYIPCGPPFQEVGLPHIEMRKSL